MSLDSLEQNEPAQVDTKAEFWRRTPPALFPTLLGVFGLGLAWRAAAGFEPLGVSILIGQGILAFAGILLMFVLACYLSKLSMRPGVILQDMASVPGRAGVSAITMNVLLFAAAIAPLSPIVATAALFAGLAGHGITSFLAVIVMIRTPQGLVVSPAWHLTFVGVIVACLSAVPLGYIALSQTILGVTVLTSAVIYGVSLFQFSKLDMPAPLRPMLVIHLAPLSLFAIVASLLGNAWIALVFATLAIGVAGVLISRTRFLTVAGFSPLWGAFTFPIAAFSSALFAISAQISLFGWVALLPLALVTLFTPIILVRLLRMWSSGVLAVKTGAAIA